jgi:hypothetical protein
MMHAWRAQLEAIRGLMPNNLAAHTYACTYYHVY